MSKQFQRMTRKRFIEQVSSQSDSELAEFVRKCHDEARTMQREAANVQSLEMMGKRELARRKRERANAPAV